VWLAAILGPGIAPWNQDDLTTTTTTTDATGMTVATAWLDGARGQDDDRPQPARNGVDRRSTVSRTEETTTMPYPTISHDAANHDRLPARPRRRLLAILAAAVLAAAACSTPAGSAVPSTPAQDSSAPSVEASASALDYPAGDLSIMAPAAPGGGWDSTARAFQKAIEDDALTTKNVEVYNVEGAGGTIGLAQLADQEKGKPDSLMVMGLVMVGAIRANNAPVDLSNVTPIASLTAEWEAIAVKSDSPYKTLADLVAAFKADPKSVSWGGGSAGGTDHILVGLLAKEAGVDPAGINYIAHSGGGEAIDDILSGAVTAGVSGVSEFTDQVAAGAMRYLAISSDAPVAGIDVPTIKDSGFAVTLANWRGIVAAPDIDPAARDAAVAFVTKVRDGAAWQATLKEKKWTDFFKPGDEFQTFLDAEVTRVEGVLKDIGLIK
jgi:putative tricarboxylic transport membrane protein